MPTPAHLLAQITANLGQNFTLGSLSAAAANDRYEAFVWLLVIEAAIAEQAQVTLVHVDGTPATAPLLRTSPGVIASQAQNYTHAVIAFPGKPLLEAHLGIHVAGKSTVTHECDVVVLEQEEATECRATGANPRYSSGLIFVECKYYSSNLPLRLAREFLGLCREMRAADCFFVANSTSDSVLKILAHMNCHRTAHVVPTSTDATKLLNLFREKFDHFKSLN
jgi:hypothetical protein